MAVAATGREASGGVEKAERTACRDGPGVRRERREASGGRLGATGAPELSAALDRTWRGGAGGFVGAVTSERAARCSRTSQERDRRHSWARALQPGPGE